MCYRQIVQLLGWIWSLSRAMDHFPGFYQIGHILTFCSVSQKLKGGI